MRPEEKIMELAASCRSYMPAESLQKAELSDAFIVDYVRVYDEVKD